MKFFILSPTVKNMGIFFLSALHLLMSRKLVKYQAYLRLIAFCKILQIDMKRKCKYNLSYSP